MPVPLGASLSDPYFVLAQIVHTTSLFYIILGASRVVVELMALFFTVTDVPISTALGSCFHISLQSLYSVNVSDDGGVRISSFSCFFLMHIAAALAMSYPLAITIQRRKFALDFVCTLYFIYFISSVIASRRIFAGGAGWWASVAVGVGVLYTATTFLCRRRELQDIFLTPVPLSANSNGNGNENGSEEMGLTVAVNVSSSPTERDALSDRWPHLPGTASPRVAEGVAMGPGCANKRRRG